jgi:Rod binding domain-containing protein
MTGITSPTADFSTQTRLIQNASVDQQRRGNFDQTLQQATSRTEQVEEAADQLVAAAFILPLLEQVRDDPFKSDMFHGGQAEEIFGQQLDVLLADRISASANFGLSESLAHQFGVNTVNPIQPGIDLHG